MKKKPKTIQEIERKNAVNLFKKMASVVGVIGLEMGLGPCTYLELQLRDDLE